MTQCPDDGIMDHNIPNKLIPRQVTYAIWVLTFIVVFGLEIHA